jgi:hypothetical protein
MHYGIQRSAKMSSRPIASTAADPTKRGARPQRKTYVKALRVDSNGRASADVAGGIERSASNASSNATEGEAAADDAVLRDRDSRGSARRHRPRGGALPCGKFGGNILPLLSGLGRGGPKSDKGEQGGGDG